MQDNLIPCLNYRGKAFISLPPSFEGRKFDSIDKDLLGEEGLLRCMYEVS